MLTELLNLLLDPRLALVHATFDVEDGQAGWANNVYNDLTLADLAAAAEWSAETTDGAVLIVQQASPDCFDIDIAHRGCCVERCYACGRLYPDNRRRVGRLLSEGHYDPTDFDCGCTSRLADSWLDASEPTEFPCGEFDDGAHWRLPVPVPEPGRWNWLTERGGDPDGATMP